LNSVWEQNKNTRNKAEEISHSLVEGQ